MNMQSKVVERSTFHGLLQRRLVGASAHVAAGQAMLLVLNFVLLAVLARYLSLRELGVYSILMEIGRIAGLICQAGTTQSSQKYLGRMTYADPYLLPVVQRRIFVILMIATALTVAFCALFWNFLARLIFNGQDIAGLAFFGSVVFVINALQGYYSAVLLAIDHTLQSVLSSGVVQKFLLLIGVTLLYLMRFQPNGITPVLWVWAASGVISVAIGTAFVQFRMRQMQKAAPTPNIVRLPGYRELIYASLPMGVTAGLATLRNSADVIIVGAVLGPASAGVYGPLRSAANLVMFLDQAIRRSVPSMIAASVGMRDTTERLCRTAADYGVLAALLPTLVFVCFGGALLALLFGPRFSECGGLIAILVSGIFISSLFGAPSSLLQMSGFERNALYANLSVTLLSIAIVPIVAASFGLNMVALVSSAFLVLQSAALTWLAFRILRVKTYVDIQHIVAMLRSGLAMVGKIGK